MGKNHEIRIKLNFEELNIIKKKASSLGLEPSVFLRMLGLSAQVPITHFNNNHLENE